LPFTQQLYNPPVYEQYSEHTEGCGKDVRRERTQKVGRKELNQQSKNKGTELLTFKIESHEE
jgi:hypothetical protein